MKDTKINVPPFNNDNQPTSRTHSLQ